MFSYKYTVIGQKWPKQENK